MGHQREDSVDRKLMQARALLGAAVLLCVVVIPIAVAGAAGDSGGPQATASASVKKKLKKLNKKVKALQAEQGQPRPPSGGAGGDLTGDYPNPSIAGGAVTNPKLASGAVNSAKVLNGSLGTAEFAKSIPAARATNTAAETTDDGATFTLLFDSERYDTANIHTGTGSDFVASVTGIYEITANVEWETNSTGVRTLILRTDAGALAVDDVRASDAGQPTGQTVTTMARLSAGEGVTVVAIQNSGGQLDINNNPQNSPEFSMTWLAPGP